MRRAAICLLFLALLGCSDPKPPQGRWEGGYQGGGTLVVARVEIGADGLVRASAPDITTSQDAKPEQLRQMRENLAADLRGGWDKVVPRKFDFDGKIFRKPGGVAPQMQWDKASNQMILQLFLGNNAALPVPLRPVDAFHDNPWPSG